MSSKSESPFRGHLPPQNEEELRVLTDAATVVGTSLLSLAAALPAVVGTEEDVPKAKATICAVGKFLEAALAVRVMVSSARTQLRSQTDAEPESQPGG